jgi:hypothetical protein
MLYAGSQKGKIKRQCAYLYYGLLFRIPSRTKPNKGTSCAGKGCDEKVMLVNIPALFSGPFWYFTTVGT